MSVLHAGRSGHERPEGSGHPIRTEGKQRFRLGILATHPIQYYSPLFRRLAAEPDVDVTVYFAHRPTAEEQGHGFGVPFEWDIDLLSGFRHVFLENRAALPSAATFKGCDTPEIAPRIVRERFDAFLVMGWHSKSYWQAMRACWSARTPCLVRGDSQLLADSRPLKRRAKRLLYPLFLRRFSAALAVGTRSDEYFRYYGALRVERSPHFVDNETFARAAAEARRSRAEIRAAWGIPADAFVCLFAGKLVPKKRPLDLVRAVAAAGRTNVHVLVAGEGELRGAMEEEARRIRVPLHVAGFLNQTQIPRAYAAADALSLPSDGRETWGLVVNEAMACGLPAIVSRDAGCSVDLVREEETGFTHRLGDVGALAGAISALAGHPDRARVMGARASVHIADFSVDAAAGGVLRACVPASAA